MTLLLAAPKGHRSREFFHTMNRGQLTGGRSNNALLHSLPSNECDVTCKITRQDGHTTMCNGLFSFKGAPVTGVELDHEAHFALEYGRPEGDLKLLNFSGRVHKLNAWITTSDGPQVVLESIFQSSIEVKEGDSIPVVGPELRYMINE